MSRQAEQLVEYIPRLRRYACALIRDRERAEDLLQDTLTRALDRLSLWRRGTDMRAWLFTIMHNLHVNALRRDGRRPDILSLQCDGVLEPRACGKADQQAGLDDIAAALQQLPEEQRAVVLLVSLEGLSYRQTAKVLGIKTGTVMSRLHRGRERLRLCLNGSQESAPGLRRVK